ncbi:hypothetical protein [Burkholderia gladioli]|uniref:hypothetical protein n=1 Tax=Burkholderia gladioli TaxID=28095 RepID=UPI00163EC0E0|nr:hypothetical protein [Burkholderia gladioli]
MTLDREEARREEAWGEATRLCAIELGIDPLTDEDEHLKLIGKEAQKLMKQWGTPMPKSVRRSKAQ